MGGDTLCCRWEVERKTQGAGSGNGDVLVVASLGVLDVGGQGIVEAPDTLMQFSTIVRKQGRRTWVPEQFKEILEIQRDFVR